MVKYGIDKTKGYMGYIINYSNYVEISLNDTSYKIISCLNMLSQLNLLEEHVYKHSFNHIDQEPHCIPRTVYLHQRTV